MKKTLFTAALTTAVATSSLFAAEEEKSSAFSDFIAPVSNPVYFESPFHTSEVRVIQMRQNFHSKVDTALGELPLDGNMDMTAVQLRWAITEDFSIIATKDGYARLSFDDTLEDQSGFADLALGMKFTIAKCEESAFMLSGGLRIEVPVGDDEILQSNGNGIVNPFISMAKGFGDIHLLAYQGVQVPIDNDENSTVAHTSFHVDYKIGDFYPLAEMNIRHVLRSGDGTSNAELELAGGGRVPTEVVSPNFGGADITNLGGSDTQGQTDISYALGFRYKIADNLTVGAVYEGEVLSNDRGIFDDRITADLILEF